MRVLITETTWAAMAAARGMEAAGLHLSRADDAASLVEYARLGAQDAVVLADDLPDTPAEAALVHLRRADADIPVLALAEAGLDPDRRAALYAAGADVVLEAPLEGAELAARLRALVLRGAGFHTSRLCVGGLEMDPATRSACVGRRAVRLPGDGTDGPNRIPLSPREYDILELLVLARGRTVSRAEIMDRLYAWEDEPGERILDVFVARIRAKLSAAGLDPRMLQALRGRGFRLSGEPPAGPVDPASDRGDGSSLSVA